MVAIPLATGDAKRTYGRLPHIQLKNLFIEGDQSNAATQVAYLQRPGLSLWKEAGSGPVDMVWRQDGTFGGDYFVASGGRLYRIGSSVTDIGAIGPGAPSIAARQNDLIVVNNGVRYLYSGSGLSVIPSPIGAAAQAVAAINNYYIIPRAQSQIFDWIEPGAVVIDALNFASAERTPDDIEDARIKGDEIWFLGRAGEEVWAPNSDINAPFLRISGRVYSKGCADRRSVVALDMANGASALAWVTSNREVVVALGAPEIISTPAIAERLRLSSSSGLRAWAFALDQHGFYVLTCDQGTFAFDMATRNPWSQFSSYQSETWRAHVGAQNGPQIIAGDSESNRLWSVDPVRSDDDGEPLVREITGGLDHSGQPQRCDIVSLKVAAGWSMRPGIEPLIEMRWSDDGGNLWSDWQARVLGQQGQYDREVAWRKLGSVKAPGRVFHWRMTDDAMLRISYARMNERSH